MCIFAGFKHLACPRNRVILSVYDKSFGNLDVILSYSSAIYIYICILYIYICILYIYMYILYYICMYIIYIYVYI